MHIIVIGCGRVGASLCKVLDTPDNNVTVVDINPAAFNSLGAKFQGIKIVGQGFDEDVLLEAGIAECDAFVAVTSLDNVNLMASEVARRLYKVPHVVTRLINPERMGLYRQLGLDYICDTELVAEGISSKIRSRRAHHIDTFGNYEILSFTLETGGDVIQVRDLEQLGDLEVTLLEHDDEAYPATPGMFLHDGDTVIVVAREDALPALSPYMKG